MVGSNLSKLDDLELMNLLARNDLSAWSELVTRYSNLVYSIAFQLLHNDSDTEDAVQNTFLRLKIFANKFDNSQPLKPWLARIASGEAIRIYHKNKSTSKKEALRMKISSTSQTFQKSDASEIVENKEIENLIKNAIDLLPETSRVALTLYYAGGLNQNEIASELGMNQVHISRKIKEGLEKIKIYLKKAGIQSAIILSPQLLQNGISLNNSLPEFLHKLSFQLPTELQLSQLISSDSIITKKVSYNKFNMAFFKYPIVFFVFLLLGYFYLIPNVKFISNSNSIEKKFLKESLTYQSADFRNFKPFYFEWGKIQKDIDNPNILQESHILHIGGIPQWYIQGDSKAKKMIAKESIEDNGSAGFLLDKKFKQAYTFKGTIRVTSPFRGVGFLISTPLKKNQDKITLNSDKNIVLDVSGTNLRFGSIVPENDEKIEFNIYIFPKANTWKAICLFKLKDGNSKINYGSLNFNEPEFSFGLFSNGKTECYNLEFKELDPDWIQLLDLETKEIINQIPKDFLPFDLDNEKKIKK